MGLLLTILFTKHTFHMRGIHFTTKRYDENDVLFSELHAQANSECSYQESNLKPSDY